MEKKNTKDKRQNPPRSFSVVDLARGVTLRAGRPEWY